MIQALILAFLYLSGTIEVWHIVVLSVILGIINAFDVPARQSLVVHMVEKKEDIGNAIALNSSMVNGARLLGLSIAGLLIAFAGEGYCFLINGISYLFVLLFVFLMKIQLPEIRKAIHPVYVRLGYIPEEISSGIQTATEMTISQEDRVH